MQTVEIKKEQFDLHLFLLLLFKKLWIVILSGVIAGVLFGGIYFLVNITFGPEDTYEMVSESYLEYAVDSNGEEYVVFNQVTWENMIDSDDIVDPIAERTGLSEDLIREYVSATLLSDTRILTTTVAGFDKGIVEQINPALLSSLEGFGQGQREFQMIRIMTKPDVASVQNQDVRVINATLLGVVVGLLLSFFVVILYLIWDDRIYHTGIFEARYQTTMLGVYGSEFYSSNCDNLLLDDQKYVAVLLDDVEAEDLDFGKRSFVKIIGNPYIRPENLKELDSDIEYQYILFVSAKRHNSKLIEATMNLFEEYDCRFDAAALMDVDEKLLKWYYFPGKRWIEKHVK